MEGRLYELVADAESGPWYAVPAGEDRRSEPPWQISAALLDPLQAMLDGLSEQVGVIAPDGTIVLINNAWRRAMQTAGSKRLDLHHNYHAFVAELAAHGINSGVILLAGLQAIYSGTQSDFKCTFEGAGPFAGREFRTVITPVALAGEKYLFVSVRDVTSLVELRRERRSFGRKLVRVQDEERRRLARDLHDSTSQLVVGLQLNLMRLKGARTTNQVESVVADCEQITGALHAEIRSLSFLAHPPLLENHRLHAALEDLVQGFGERSNLGVETEILELDGISQAAEIALYRVAQEALVNVYRHAKATRVRMSLKQIGGFAQLEIRDDGIGIGPDRKRDTGVGLRGMRERVREVHGSLAVRKCRPGTMVRARVPSGDRETPSI